MFRKTPESVARRQAREARKGPIDLSTEKGRKRAHYELTWGDHGFLRAKFRNLHQISDEMWRANQPSPIQVKAYAEELGIKTILNLRGESPKGYYLLEKEACEANGIELVDFQVFSRDTPTRERIFEADELFQKIKYPALMHCKSGADRAGIMSVLYKTLREGVPVSEAKQQLSFDYLHIKHGKTGVLDAVFEAYEDFNAKTPISFRDWVSEHYDREAIKAEFLASGRGKLKLDQLLRRE
ncbi:MAG: protein tyrosine phosphatase [Ponticaulis sp.]|nr:protein tyrosine phosphatase [Ponticaulis sp.]